MNNLAKRTLVGVPGAAMIVWLIFFNAYSFALLFFLITVLSLNEFYSRSTDGIIKPQRWIGLFCGIVVYLVIISLKCDLTVICDVPSFDRGMAILLLIPILFSIFVIELYRKSQHPFTNIAFTFLGLIYIPVTMGMATLIGWSSDDGGFHPSNMFGYFFILWAHDIGAYFAGRWWGKHKLFERISPKKTWEGTAGGVVFSFIVAHFISIYCPGFSRMEWFAITVIILITSTLGDLVESMFKRSISIKDSGTLLPGHGGMLDRFDGVFISAPFVYVFLELVHRI
ncbi:MAG: phosphatidate cytidylyltransferase [Bacteroidota bacterium]